MDIEADLATIADFRRKLTSAEWDDFGVISRDDMREFVLLAQRLADKVQAFVHAGDALAEVVACEEAKVAWGRAKS